MTLRALPLLGIALTLVLAACSGSTAEPEDLNGLRPGSYSMIFELFPSLLTPEGVLGVHRVTFRVREPGTSAEDFEIVASSVTPPEGPRQNETLTVDPERLQISENRWVLRFPSVDGTYTLTLVLGNAGFGEFQILVGCTIQPTEGGSILAAGCVIDRQ